MRDFVEMMETSRLTLKMSNKTFALELGFSPKQYSWWKCKSMNPSIRSRMLIKKRIRELLGFDEI